MPVLDRKELEESPLADLHAIASELGIEGYRRLRKEQLIEALVTGEAPSEDDAPAKSSGRGGDSDDEDRPRGRSRGGRGRGGSGRSRSGSGSGGGGRGRGRGAARDDDDAAEAKGSKRDEEDRDDDAPEEAEEERSGVLDVLPNGSGFMRPEPFAHSREDVYVSPSQIRRCELRPGDELSGGVRKPRRNERHPSLVRVDKVNGADADPPQERPRFEELTPLFASERLPAPDGLKGVPFGKGSRVAVGGVAGAGITSLLRNIVGKLSGADGLELTVVLAGVRPEEVTEWRREDGLAVAGGGFDRPIDEQAQAAEMAVERAKRAAESGRDAVIVIDGLDALPAGAGRRVFAAARNTEEAGSVTVIASTGLAGEPQRVATTRIILEPGGSPDKPQLAPASGTLRAESLS